MTIEEFSELCPDEFGAVWEAYLEQEERQEKSRWERMRLLATITIQPHVTERISAPELLPLPWDKAEGSTDAVGVVDDERRRRAEEVLRRIG